MNKTVFITATDTGVGKTTVSAALAKLAKDAGINVGYFKPVETGCEEECLDAKTLSNITGQDIDEVVLYKYKNPVAPLVAEEEEGKKIDIKKIKEHLENLKEKYELLIVEGAGGIAVPITKVGGKIYTYLDFAYENNLPTFVVARANLGTINHTYLTVKALKDKNIKVLGTILNGLSEMPSLAEKTNPYIIKEMTEVDIWCICKHKENPVEECYQKLQEFFTFHQNLL